MNRQYDKAFVIPKLRHATPGIRPWQDGVKYADKRSDLSRV
jgi:hypothetical protein